MNKVIILGKGARESAIEEKLQSCNVTKVTNLDSLKQENYDLLIPSMENDLVDGIVENSKIPCFGPSKSAAQIEGSKIFSKIFMKQNKINTSHFCVFDLSHETQEAYNYLYKNFNTIKQVIKLDGLCSGKGVFIPETLEDAKEIISNLSLRKEKVIIENRIYGNEVSLMGFCNGKNIELMPQIMDFKRIYDDDKGPNTGGMGALGPVNILTKEELINVKHDMLKVVRKLNFKGILYAGLIKNETGYYVLEFNCRFGDPETQVALNLLDPSTDLYTVMLQCINGDEIKVKWKDNCSCSNVVLSHINYPYSKLNKPVEINIKQQLDKDIKIYWANLDDQKRTKGGRVASVVCVSNNLFNSLNKIYNNIYKINYQGKYYRKDIGYKYLLKNNISTDKRLKLAVLSSSRGTSISKLIEENVVDLIISNKQSEILEKGKSNKITTIYMPTINYAKLINILESFEIDIIYAVGFMSIFPKFFCDYYENKLFNIHPSLLPLYSNMISLNIHKNVIEDNKFVTGCTLHKVTEKIDKGQIMLQKQILVTTRDPVILKSKVQELEKNILYDFYLMYHNFNIDYKSSGVNITKSDQLIEEIKDENIGNFCAINKINNQLITSGTDGVGTKIELAKAHNKYENIGIDLVAMSVNDLLVRGSKPLLFLDYLAVNKLDKNIFNTIINSIKKGCKIANIKLVGGETAEMSDVYKYQGMDMAGFAIGTIEHNIYPLTNKMTEGCKIYGIKSNGVHSNGFSLVRKLLKLHNYDENVFLKPTLIYNECLDLIEKYKDSLLGMAHITGGGLLGNIKRIIPDNLKPCIEVPIKNEFKWIMDKGKLDYNQMLETFNCGYGIALIFKKDFEVNMYDQIGVLKKI